MSHSHTAKTVDIVLHKPTTKETITKFDFEGNQTQGLPCLIRIRALLKHR